MCDDGEVTHEVSCKIDDMRGLIMQRNYFTDKTLMVNAYQSDY